MSLIDLYATSPASAQLSPEEFRRRTVTVARWAEAAGCRGVLVFTDNESVDPWSVAQLVIEHTDRLVPLVAAQPPYMHPYAVARLVSSIAFLYGRQLDLNLVTGGNPHRLRTMSAPLGHDERYDRLAEYGSVISGLLSGGEEPMDFSGTYYELRQARIRPALPMVLQPKIYVAGSSPACLRVAQRLGVNRLSYPRALSHYASDDAEMKHTGVRLGVIARASSGEAWRVARQRFPPDRDGERNNATRSRMTESRWHHQLFQDVQAGREPDNPYWLYPFQAHKQFCPYLVGSYAEVGRYLAGYLDMGVSTLILNEPRDPDDLHHARLAIARAA
ncbi:LLM class flavin-dependent oxidoreductase [Streptomyces tauricus]|uniref:LLM class flavin-dependent oxidoreductase n=1 Tax=Streptomyces tauricus TaxID=68274 RepID=A0ABZ1JSP3_9ACTN|nr:LLM class flavin-dependent oxidoreductase [Streptomyces tauricus]